MASIRKQEAGAWRVQVRRKGRSVSENFVRYEDAKRWAVDAERQIDRGETPTVSRVGKLKTFGELIDLHISDMKEVGKAPGRSKSATLKMLKHELGDLNMVEVDRERIVKFGRARAKEGAGPVTLSMDIGAIKLVIQHAAAVHGIPVKVEPVDLGRVALKRLGLIGKSNERDRRPTEEELEKLFRLWDENDRQLIPMSRIVKFAIAAAMRQEEISRVTWEDLMPPTPCSGATTLTAAAAMAWGSTSTPGFKRQRFGTGDASWWRPGRTPMRSGTWPPSPNIVAGPSSQLKARPISAARPGS
jgi:hypothetical protein